MELDNMREVISPGFNGTDYGRVERWESECPHGYTVYEEKDYTPGFKCHDTWTDCPWCNRKDRYTAFARQFGSCLKGDFCHCPDRFNIIYDTAIKNGELKPNYDMWQRMKHDLDFVKWFAYHGILNGIWDEECHRVWRAWLSRRFF